MVALETGAWPCEATSAHRAPLRTTCRKVSSNSSNIRCSKCSNSITIRTISCTSAATSLPPPNTPRPVRWSRYSTRTTEVHKSMHRPHRFWASGLHRRSIRRYMRTWSSTVNSIQTTRGLSLKVPEQAERHIERLSADAAHSGWALCTHAGARESRICIVGNDQSSRRTTTTIGTFCCFGSNWRSGGACCAHIREHHSTLWPAGTATGLAGHRHHVSGDAAHVQLLRQFVHRRSGSQCAAGLAHAPAKH